MDNKSQCGIKDIFKSTTYEATAIRTRIFTAKIRCFVRAPCLASVRRAAMRICVC